MPHPTRTSDAAGRRSRLRAAAVTTLAITGLLTPTTPAHAHGPAEDTAVKDPAHAATAAGPQTAPEPAAARTADASDLGYDVITGGDVPELSAITVEKCLEEGGQLTANAVADGALGYLGGSDVDHFATHCLTRNFIPRPLATDYLGRLL